jgi:hypothetical protein
MNQRIPIVVVSILTSIFLPMMIGAWRELGLNPAADGNQTLESAEKYYHDVTYGLSDHEDRRAEFAQTGYNSFGIKGNIPSKC